MKTKEANNPEEVQEEQEGTKTKEESSLIPEGTEEGTGKEEGKQPQKKEDLQEEGKEEEGKKEEEAKEGELSFTEKIDPKKLSKELQPIYKGMQADYTKKMQEIAGIQTEYGKATQAREVLEKLWADPEFQKWRVTETDRRKAAAKMQEEPDLDAMTEEQRIQWYVDKAVAKNQAEMEKKFASTYGVFMNTKMSEEAQAKIDNFRKSHSEITDVELASLAPIIRLHQVDMEQAYILKFPERFKEAAVEKARAELRDKKKANLETGEAPEGAPTLSDLPSFDEAVKAAKEEVGIK